MSNNQLSSGFKLAGLSFTSNQSPTTNSKYKDEEKQSKPKTILNFLAFVYVLSTESKRKAVI